MRKQHETYNCIDFCESWSASIDVRLERVSFTASSILNPCLLQHCWPLAMGTNYPYSQPCLTKVKPTGDSYPVIDVPYSEAWCSICLGRLVLSNDCVCDNETWVLRAEQWYHGKGKNPYHTCYDCGIDPNNPNSKGWVPEPDERCLEKPNGSFVCCYMHRQRVATYWGLPVELDPPKLKAPPAPKPKAPQGPQAKAPPAWFKGQASNDNAKGSAKGNAKGPVQAIAICEGAKGQVIRNDIQEQIDQLHELQIQRNAMGNAKGHGKASAIQPEWFHDIQNQIFQLNENLQALSGTVSARFPDLDDIQHQIIQLNEVMIESKKQMDQLNEGLIERHELMHEVLIQRNAKANATDAEGPWPPIQNQMNQLNENLQAVSARLADLERRARPNSSENSSASWTDTGDLQWVDPALDPPLASGYKFDPSLSEVLKSSMK